MKLMKLSLFLLVISVDAGAESTPEELVKQIDKRLKATEDLTVILEYVDWPSAFGQLTHTERHELAVATKEEYERAMRRRLTGVDSYIDASFASAINSAPEEFREQVGASLAEARLEVIEALRPRFNEFKERIVKGEIAIAESLVDKDRAVLDITVNHKNRLSTHRVPLVLINDRWRVQALRFLDAPPDEEPGYDGPLW